MSIVPILSIFSSRRTLEAFSLFLSTVHLEQWHHLTVWTLGVMEMLLKCENIITLQRICAIGNLKQVEWSGVVAN